MEETRLTEHTRFGGCAAKMGPSELAGMLCGIDIPQDENVIAGIEGYEDAGVYRISEDVCMVQTIDFFTPIVDDPYHFGQIAAANALSDIYAMGGVPRTALNMVCFSPKRFGMGVLKEILRGGIDKVRESGASLLGGHSVEDEEIKYGLSVTGFVHPDRIVFNEGAQPGDTLVLTKPLGTGILSTGMRGKRLSPEGGERLIRTMAELNDRASRAMLSAGVRAATDVTGFGLAGHVKEMIKENIGVEIFAANLPFFPEVPGLIEAGFMSSGLYKNRDFYAPHVIMEHSGFARDLIFDPQSSGGLLMALAEGCSDRFREAASRSSLEFWIIGRFMEEPRGKIVVR